MNEPKPAAKTQSFVGIEQVKNIIAVASGKGGVGKTTVAVADVKRAVAMFQKAGKKILGIVENMSYFCCEHSDDKIEIFGSGGGEELSRTLHIPLLASLPIDIELRKGGDCGIPLMAQSSETGTGKVFSDMATQISAM